MEFELKNDIACISISDGKANVVGHAFVDGIMQYLERAEAEAKAVVIHAREGMFSAGFDLKELQKGQAEAAALVGRGMEMLTRLYAHPQPVVAACDGHAIGLGAFILLASDFRLGSAADYNITLPETAIGMPFRPVLMALIKDRIASAQQTIAVLQSKPFTATEAVASGFLDKVISRDSLRHEADALAEALTQLPGEIYGVNKQDLRSASLLKMRDSIA